MLPLRVDRDVRDRVLVAAAELLDPLDVAVARELDEQRVGGRGPSTSASVVPNCAVSHERAADHPAAVGRRGDGVRAVGVDAAERPQPLRVAVSVEREREQVVGADRLVVELADLELVEEVADDDDVSPCTATPFAASSRLGRRTSAAHAILPSGSSFATNASVPPCDGFLPNGRRNRPRRRSSRRRTMLPFFADGDAARRVDAEAAEPELPDRLAGRAARIRRERRQRRGRAPASFDDRLLRGRAR